MDNEACPTGKCRRLKPLQRLVIYEYRTLFNSHFRTDPKPGVFSRGLFPCASEKIIPRISRTHPVTRGDACMSPSLHSIGIQLDSLSSKSRPPAARVLFSIHHFQIRVARLQPYIPSLSFTQYATLDPNICGPAFANAISSTISPINPFPISH